MKSSSKLRAATIVRRSGKGYRPGPRKPPPIPADASWISPIQVFARWRSLVDVPVANVRDDANFSKARSLGRLLMFSVATDAALISKTIGPER